MIFSYISILSSDIGNEIKEKLIPSWTSFVMQIAALAIMILVVSLVAYKPMKKMLKKRQDFVTNNIDNAKKENELAQINHKESEERLLNSKKEASEIVANAKLQAENEREIIINNAHVEANKIKEKAYEDIEQSKKEALDDIHDEMVEVALMASKEILKREVSEEDNSRLTEEFIKNL